MISLERSVARTVGLWADICGAVDVGLPLFAFLRRNAGGAVTPENFAGAGEPASIRVGAAVPPATEENNLSLCRSFPCVSCTGMFVLYMFPTSYTLSISCTASVAYTFFTDFFVLSYE